MIGKVLRSNIIPVVIQLIALGIYAVSILAMIKVESVVLNPIPYFLGLGVVIILIDTLILLYLFKEQTALNIDLTTNSVAVNTDGVSNLSTSSGEEPTENTSLNKGVD